MKKGTIMEPDPVCGSGGSSSASVRSCVRVCAHVCQRRLAVYGRPAVPEPD